MWLGFWPVLRWVPYLVKWCWNWGLELVSGLERMLEESSTLSCAKSMSTFWGQLYGTYSSTIFCDKYQLSLAALSVLELERQDNQEYLLNPTSFVIKPWVPGSTRQTALAPEKTQDMDGKVTYGDHIFNIDKNNFFVTIDHKLRLNKCVSEISTNASMPPEH